MADGGGGRAPAEAGEAAGVPARGGREAVRDLVFFSLFFLYLWLEVDLRLVYHGGPAVLGFPPFFRGGAFFRPFLSRPGGLVEYGSAFFAQGFALGWAGALVVTLQAWLISLGTGGYLGAMGARRPHGARFLGPVLMLIGYAEYRYTFRVTTTVLAAVLLAWGYARGRPRSDRLAVPVFLGMHLAAYVVAGAGHFLFAALAAIHEGLARRRWGPALVCAASAAVLPGIVGFHGFGVAAADAYGCGLFAPLEPHVYGVFAGTVAKLSLLYLFLPVAAVVLRPRRGGAGAGAPASAGPFRRAAGFAAPLVLGAAVVGIFRDAGQKAELRIGYCSYHGRWTELLEVAEGLRRKGRYPNPAVLHAVARALYHSGRLGTDLFRHPLGPGVLLLSDESYPEIYVGWYRFDTLLDLGQVNYAEFHLNHCAEYFGPRPVLLKRLAWVHLGKGDLPTARVYLHALSRTLFDAGWARGYLERLRSDPALSADGEIQRLRRRRVEKDRAVHPARYEDRHGFSDMERMLLELLEKDPGNRMAAEYLMALYLLNRRPDMAVAHLGRLRRAGFSRLPPLYEEAVLVHAMIRGAPPEPGLFEIGEEARARAARFSEALGGYWGDRDPRRLEEFRGGYLHYHFFGGAVP